MRSIPGLLLAAGLYGTSGMVPKGLEDVSKFPVLVRGLLELGYSDGDIRKIMGENLLRVMKQAEQVSREMSR
jgi:microsomal dipeptidase-like Zn-dependent dipeptidase